jgi:hypothetical protein
VPGASQAEDEPGNVHPQKPFFIQIVSPFQAPGQDHKADVSRLKISP